MFRRDANHTGYNSEELVLNPPLLLKWTFEGILHPGPASSPAVSDGIVYIRLYATLYALDSQTGTLIWSKPTTSNTEYDQAGPAVAYGMVYIGNYCDFYCGVVAYDAKTGAEKWHLDLPSKGARGVNVYNGIVYFGSDDHYVRAADAYTGQLLWTSPYLNDGVTAVPAIANGKVFVGTWTGKVYAFDVTNGQIIWQKIIGGVMFSSPTVINDTLYIGSGMASVFAINTTDGSIKWEFSGAHDSVWGSPAVYNNILYIQDLAGYIYALDSSTGSVKWSYKTGSIPSSSYSSPAVANSAVYVGSQDSYIYAFDVYTGAVLWKYETGGPIVDSSPAIANGIVYVGSDDGKIYAFDNVGSVTPTPLPVSKVVVVPGFGASWNADAILNCKLDGYSGDWTLASYASDIYNPLISALGNAGWETLPYYYDWRKRIPNNATLLSSYIKSVLVENEKINLVGHSMGGLLGRAYLESETTNNKLEGLLTVGSPHKGTALAYPAWSGGDIWEDNFIYKIAMSLYLKHCGGLFSNDRETIQNQVPSVQNLLPTYNYLRYTKRGSLLPVSAMSAQNGWIPNYSLTFPFYHVRVGTLAGTGFDTLETIPVRERSKHDEVLGNWIDGKPLGKEKNIEGDGTILTVSSLVGSAENTIIGQTHSGLVASSEGINQILSFLGAVPLASTFSYSEPNSALIIIGYPANFWVIDTNGKIVKDKDGLVSFINPKSGQYKLGLIPETSNTLFIVAQFLPNGQTLYKEYKLSGILPKFKTIKFDLDNPLEDPIN